MPRPFSQHPRNTMNSCQEAPASPCVNVCCLDQNNLCVGCFRTLDEIKEWRQMDPAARTAILLQTERRRRHYPLADQ